MFSRGQLYFDSYAKDNPIYFENEHFWSLNATEVNWIKSDEANWISLCRIFGVVAEFTWKAYYDTFGRV